MFGVGVHSLCCVGNKNERRAGLACWIANTTSDRSITSTLPELDSTRLNVLLLDIIQTFYRRENPNSRYIFIYGSFRYMITYTHIPRIGL